MAGYLGNKFKISGRYTVDEFTSSGGTTYTLSNDPGEKNNIQVSAGGLTQYPSAYSVSGTTLTLSGVPSGQKVVVRHMGDTIPFPLLDDNVVTLAKMASGTDGNIITYDASGNPAAVATGTAGQVLTSAGAGAPPTFVTAAGGGKIVQVVNVMNSSVASGTTAIPSDDTIPQNTEGDEYMTLAITPTSATNKLLITTNVFMSHSGTYKHLTIALFQDSTAGALKATQHNMSDATGVAGLTMEHYMAAGTTSATTFRIRAGTQTASTTTFNGHSGSTRKMGGVVGSSITIMEIAV